MIVAEYRDDGVSAYDTKKDRPDWTRAMADIVARKIDVLWVWEVSRASRDRGVWATLVAACTEAGVLLAVDGKLHDFRDPDDGFMLDLGAAIAVRESAHIGKRVRRATDAAAEAGRPFGSIPFGYRREYDPRSGSPVRQVPDEETASVVREIVTRVLAGDGLHKIAVDLNRRGVPTPQNIRDRRLGRVGVQRGGWNNPKIRKLLESPTMAGWRVHRGEIFGRADWEPIVSPADYSAALAIINDPSRRTQRGTEPRHLLSGVGECGVCGAWLRWFSNRGRPSYGCSGVNNTHAGHVARRAEPLVAAVTIRVIERLEDPRLFEGFVRATQQHDHAILGAGQEIAQLQAQLAEYEAAAARGGVAAESFARVVAGLAEQIDLARSRLAGARVLPRAVLDLAGPDARKRWEDLGENVPVQRLAVRSLLRVVVHRSNQPRGVHGFDQTSIELIDL